MLRWVKALLSIFDEEALVMSEAIFYPAAPDKAGVNEKVNEKETQKERKDKEGQEKTRKD